MSRGRIVVAAGLLLPLAAAAVPPEAAPFAAAPARAEEDWAGKLPPELASEVPSARDEARKLLLARADADEVIVEVLRSASQRERAGAGVVAALADLVGERKLTLANSGLRAILRDEALPAATRAAAARALEKTGSIADVGALGDALAAIPEPCCRALVAIGGEAALGALRRSMGEPPPPEAIAALARLGDPSRLRELLPALTDSARDKRERAAELLRWATGRDFKPDIAEWRSFLDRRDLAAVFEGPDPDAAHRAVEEWAAKIRNGGRDAGALVAEILSDPGFSDFARSKAALTLGLSGRSDWNAALLAATANLQPGDVRWAAANALSRVGDLSCAAPLAKMLVHDEDRDRLAAKRSVRLEFSPVDPAFVRTLHRMGVRGGTCALIDVLAGEYRTGLHRDALRALQEVSGGETFGFQPDASQASRTEALERIRAWWREARETLTITPRKDDPGAAQLRKDVDELISQLGQFKFIYQFRVKKALVILAELAEEPLVAALRSEDVQIRIGAADTMEGSTLRVFASPLAARLPAEPNAGVRTKLLNALETCGRRDGQGRAPGGDAVLATVRASLADRDLDVRIAAARTLGVVGDGSDVARLTSAAAESKNRVDAFRAAAAGARLLLGDRTAIEDFCRELRCDDVARQADAVRMLRAAHVDLHGFDPDGPPEAREAAVKAIEADRGAAGAAVPPGTQR
jgi:HEAT repeat protein